MKKLSILDRLMNLIGASVPTRNELKTQKTKAFFKILLLILCILLVVAIILSIISLYFLGFFLRFFGKILTFGAAADYVHHKSQDRHFEENGGYY